MRKHFRLGRPIPCDIMWAAAVRRVDIEGLHLQIVSALLLAGAVFFPLLPGHGGFTCPLLAITGIPCPLCGMTTSVVASSRGKLDVAIAANPAGLLAVIGAIALLVLRPQRVQIPVGILIFAVTGMWLYELFRFSVL
jgi:hypothetical protein